VVQDEEHCPKIGDRGVHQGEEIRVEEKVRLGSVRLTLGCDVH
jgi:hypothetical protein